MRVKMQWSPHAASILPGFRALCGFGTDLPALEVGVGRVGRGVCFIDCSFYSSWSSTSSPESPEIGPRKKEARRDNVPGRMCPQEKDGQVTFAFLIV